MDITIPNQETDFSYFKSSKIVFISGISLLSLSQPVFAGEVDFSANAEAEVIYQNVESDSSGDGNLLSQSLKPSALITYNSKRINGYASGTLTYLNRDSEYNSSRDSFPQYSHALNVSLIPNLLTLSSSGNQTYRVTNAGNFLVADTINNASEQTKTSSQRFSLNWNQSRGDFLRSSAVLSKSYFSSDMQYASTDALENTSTNASLSLMSGDEAKYMIWSIDGQSAEIERDGNENGDFSNYNLAAKLDFMLLKEFGLRFNTTKENYDFSGSGSTQEFERERNFESFGGGLVYRQNPGRYLSVTYNKSTNKQLFSETEEDNDFVGVDFAWALSGRTSLAFNYGRRFYGKSASGDISYNSKYFRSRLKYSESVTNSTQLLSNPENLGIFVCPDSAFSGGDFSSCFQPDSLDYQTKEGEQLLQILGESFDLQEDIVLRKGVSSEIGYAFSRIQYALSVNYFTYDFLEQLRKSTNFTTQLNVSYNLGRLTRLSGILSYAKIKQDVEDTGTGNSESYNLTLNLNRKINDNLTSKLTGMLLKQSGDDISGIGLSGGAFGANYTEVRITFGIEYSFQ